jgi:signal transduction histidine kinase
MQPAREIHASSAARHEIRPLETLLNPDGSLDLSTGFHGALDPRRTVTIEARDEGDAVRVEVRDTGEGIDARDTPYIFEHFSQAEKSRNRATGGAGLGLAIARGIAGAHGGEIGAESPPDQGTRFFFTLPRRESLGGGV